MQIFPNRPPRILIRAFKETLWISGLLVFGAIIGGSAIYFFGLPSIEDIRTLPKNRSAILYDRTGAVELYRLYDEENRVVLQHGEIPDIMRHATIAAEDRRFFAHHGVDMRSIFRAILRNFEGGEIRQGGSTITQQVARALYLTRERTFPRKLKEIFLAIKIEQKLSKDEILDLYLNTVPYGNNAYGIEAAAKTYFGKKALDLNPKEAALLASLPSAPTFYNPNGPNRKLLALKQSFVLSEMRSNGFLSDAEWQTIHATDPMPETLPRKQSLLAPHFVFYVLDELKKTYDENTLRTGGFHIITSIDMELQTLGESVVRDGAIRNRSRGAENAALVATDPRNGHVLAMVGSKDYFDTTIDGNVNVTTSARQPGSAFKPFTYATAFSKGYEPETKIIDAPVNFGPDGSGKPYIPKNYDGKFHGLLTMRQALAMSLNVPAVQTLALAGIDDTIALATKLGITTLTDPKRYGLALTLGGAEVRPIDMAHAFGVFGQEGILHPITPVLSIQDRNGKKLFEATSDPGTSVLDPEVARRINSILSDNDARTPIFGPRSPLAFPKGTAVAAKTGTTQNFNDAWTVGYTPFISVAVWTGNNDHRPMRSGSDGVFVAAPIWRAFIDKTLPLSPVAHFTPYQPATNISPEPVRPPGVKLAEARTIYIDKKTGREISPEKARKLKKGRVETISTDDLPTENL